MRVQRAERAPLSWTVRNRMRPAFWLGWLAVMAARFLSRLTGIPTLTSALSIRAHLGGRWVDFGVVGYRVITDTGVALLVDDWQAGTPRINDMKYHGCGTGGAAEAVGNTALTTECTTALNPDSTRATGTMTQPTAPVVRSVGTLTFDDAAAVTEHGLFNQAATGGGVLWDRTLFSAVNVASGDSIQFTYNCTVSSGG